MSRLIDADVAIENIEEWLDSVGTAMIGKGLSYTGELMGCIEDAPTVDAVPVVRCRECKHLNVVNRKELYAHCPKTNTVFLPFELDTREHFCSLGERKEGADNG